MKREPKVFLEHILESIDWIEIYLKTLSKGQFFKDSKSQDAVMRRLEIIGEAAKNLPAGYKKNHPIIPWRKVSGMRDFLIHEYFGVDLNLVWNTVKKDLPEFKKQILGLLETLSDGLPLWRVKKK